MHGNEAAAIGALKTLGTSQALFRDEDRDGDKLHVYGTLGELRAAGLVDSVLGSGTKQGYVFEVRVGKDPGTQWAALASPLEPGESGERHLVANHEGVTYSSAEGPFRVDASCEIAAGATRIGK